MEVKFVKIKNLEKRRFATKFGFNINEVRIDLEPIKKPPPYVRCCGYIDVEGWTVVVRNWIPYDTRYPDSELKVFCEEARKIAETLAKIFGGNIEVWGVDHDPEFRALLVVTNNDSIEVDYVPEVSLFGGKMIYVILFPKYKRHKTKYYVCFLKGKILYSTRKKDLPFVQEVIKIPYSWWKIVTYCEHCEKFFVLNPRYEKILKNLKNCIELKIAEELETTFLKFFNEIGKGKKALDEEDIEYLKKKEITDDAVELVRSGKLKQLFPETKEEIWKEIERIVLTKRVVKIFRTSSFLEEFLNFFLLGVKYGK